MSYPKQTWKADRGSAVDFTAMPCRPTRRKRRKLEPAADLPTVAEIGNAENLIETYYQMREVAGQAPGPDGVMFEHLSRREVADLMRILADTIRSGEYVHGPVRPVPIPKPKGGTRTLKIANLFDRVVSALLNRMMTPHWEGLFLPSSYGFRPRRSCWNMLANLEAMMATTNRWVLAIDDVRKAFDFVDIERLQAIHAQHVHDEELLDLIMTVLRGSDGPTRKIGIDQGAAYSPTALSVLLHPHHDLPLSGDYPHSWRFADNVVNLSQTITEGESFLQSSRELLGKIGLTLKGEDGPPTDLSAGGPVQLLGFTITRHGNRLAFRPGTEALNKLEQSLTRAHEHANPPLTANQAITGWINYMGPAFESERTTTLDQVLTLAAKLGFRETNPDQLQKQATASLDRWHRLRKREHDRVLDTGAGDGGSGTDENEDPDRRCRARPSMRASIETPATGAVQVNPAALVTCREPQLGTPARPELTASDTCDSCPIQTFEPEGGPPPQQVSVSVPSISSSTYHGEVEVPESVARTHSPGSNHPDHPLSFPGEEATFVRIVRGSDAITCGACLELVSVPVALTSRARQRRGSGRDAAGLRRARSPPVIQMPWTMDSRPSGSRP